MPLCDGLKQVAEYLDLDEQMVHTLGELQYLTHIVCNPSTSLLLIDNMVISIQYRLLIYLAARSYGSSYASLIGACGIGIFIYLKTIYYCRLNFKVETYPTGVPMYGVVLQKLRSCLNGVDASEPQIRDLFLWILFLGGGAAGGTKERAWFVARLAKGVKEWGINNWEDAKLLLKRFLWVDDIHERFFIDLWNEVETTVRMLLTI